MNSDTHTPDDSVLDHCYPISFVSNNDKIATRLQVPLRDSSLLNSVHKCVQDRSSTSSCSPTMIHLLSKLYDISYLPKVNPNPSSVTGVEGHLQAGRCRGTIRRAQANEVRTKLGVLPPGSFR